MATKIGISTLNASTYDILNVIRANGSYEYQSLVPEVKDASDVRRVGEVLFGYPSLANQFVNALVNRIALVRVKSATFNNAYAELKKGYLEFGETVEEVFVGIAKAREFSADKAEQRELKRTLPDVRTAFHTMNWKVQYPVTIQQEDLRMAFLSVNGVQDLIAKIVNAVYTAAEYDEFLLFKYLMIKGITSGKMHPVSIGAEDATELHAVSYRGMSNKLTFMSDKYNATGVTTTTTKKDQYIFMDSIYNAQYDVTVLASAFNMEKAEFMGKLKLIDDWTTFDNDRFSVIMENSDMIEEVTAEELALMRGVKAVLVDEEWFQVYDYNNKFTEKYVASGDYWNYFFNVWKSVSSSPFSNAIVFVVGDTPVSLPQSVTFNVTEKSASDSVTVFTLEKEREVEIADSDVVFVQTKEATENGVAIHKYGAVMIPSTADDVELTLEVTINGESYVAETKLGVTTEVGVSITFNKI